MAGKLKALQLWCKIQCEGYRDVNITNMTTSWKSGLAFCAIIHKYNPELIDYENLSKENVFENCQLAFDAGQSLGIPALLDPEDMVLMEVPDKLCIITYVSQYYNYFKDKPKVGGPDFDRSKLPQKRSFISLAAGDQPEKKKQQVTEKSKGRRSTYGDTCVVCGEKVYLIERHIDNHHLYHRVCFRTVKKSDAQPLTEKNDNVPPEDKFSTSNNFSESKQNIPEKMEVESTDDVFTNGDSNHVMNGAIESSKISDDNNKIDSNRYNLRGRIGLKHFDNKVELNKIDSKNSLLFDSDEKSKKDKPLGGRPATVFSQEKPAVKETISNLSELPVINSVKKGYERRSSVDLRTNKISQIRNPVEFNSSAQLTSKDLTKNPSESEKSAMNLRSSSNTRKNEDISTNHAVKKTNIRNTSKEKSPILVDNESSANTDTLAKPAWQLEAERRQAMRKGKYVDPEKAKLIQTLKEKEKSVSSLYPKSERNEEILDKTKSSTHIDKTRKSPPVEFIECDSHGNPVPSRSLGNISSPANSSKTNSQMSNFKSLSAINNDKLVISSYSKDIKSNKPLELNTKLHLSANDKSPLNQRKKPPIDSSSKSTASITNYPISSKLSPKLTITSKFTKSREANSDINGNPSLTINNTSSSTITNKLSNIDNPPTNTSSNGLSILNNDNRSETSSKSVLDEKQQNESWGESILSKFNLLAKNPPESNNSPIDSTISGSTNAEENKNILPETKNDTATKSATGYKYISPFFSRKYDLSIGKPSSEITNNSNPINLSSQYLKVKYQPKLSLAEESVKNSTSKLKDDLSKLISPESEMPESTKNIISNERKVIAPSKCDMNDFYDDLNIRRDSVESVSSMTSSKSEILPLVPPRRYKTRSMESLDSDSSRKLSLGIRPLPPLPDDKEVNYRRASISAEKPIPSQVILNQLRDVDIQLQKLEREGVVLEQQIRAEKSGDVDDDNLMVKWFYLVNGKNALVRKESELMYRQRQQELEAQHADIDLELRFFMDIPEDEKTSSQKAREQTLINMIVEIVSARNHIVDSIEEDRLRYLEEDQEIAEMMQLKGFIKDDLEKNKLKPKKMKKEKKRKKFQW